MRLMVMEPAAALELADVIISSSGRLKKVAQQRCRGIAGSNGFRDGEQVRLLKAAEDKHGKTGFKRAERDEKASRRRVSKGAHEEQKREDELEVILTNPDDGFESLELKAKKQLTIAVS